MFSLRSIVIAFMLGALLVLPAAYFVHRYDTDAEQVKVDVLKQEAQDSLLEQTRLTSVKETQLAALGQQIEVTHNAAQKVLDDNTRLNAQLVAARGLFDPGRRHSSGGTVPAVAASGPASVPVGGTDDGRLSAGADRFLLALTGRANDTRSYAQGCFDWAHKVSTQWNARQGATPAVSPASTPAQ